MADEDLRQDADVDRHLEFLGESMSHVRGATYYWISTKRFRWHNAEIDIDKESAVKAVAAHPQYRDHYTSPDSVTEASIHGPYDLEAIESDSFDALSKEQAVQVLWDWLAARDVTSLTELTGDPGSIFAAINTSTLRFQLRDLGKSAQHDFGWILGDFTELLLVDGATQAISVVVAAYD